MENWLSTLKNQISYKNPDHLLLRKKLDPAAVGSIPACFGGSWAARAQCLGRPFQKAIVA